MSSRPVRDTRSFVREFASIPMVSTSLQLGSTLYQNLKKCNQYLDTTLTTTEELMALILNAPALHRMAQKVEMPLMYIDSVAWDGLVILENKYPAITMEPQELKGEAIRQAMVLKDAGAKKLDEVVHVVCRHRRRGMVLAMNYLEAVMGPKVAVYVDLLERRIDDYLPPIEKPIPLGDNGAVIVYQENEKPKVFARLAFIPRTVQQRIAERYQRMIKMTNANEEAMNRDQDNED